MAPPPPEHAKPSPHRFLVSNSSHPVTKRIKFAENSPESRSNPPRFVPSQNVTQATATKPTFVNASTSSSISEDPLPEVFSPNRQGQRFVAGGMAAQLQSWIEEIKDQAIAARAVEASEFSAIMQIDICRGDDVFFVTGKDSHNRAMRAMLLPSTGHTRELDIALLSGTRIGLRSPTWQTELDSEVWTVVADWKILG